MNLGIANPEVSYMSMAHGRKRAFECNTDFMLYDWLFPLFLVFVCHIF